ncbi:DUF6230 family protein [Dactylosporangium sp. NPDC000244]|uniref:DUF6230 family protein n=1 Tax=Dactylosporangium sp. NPDC000244 TaxID=3154365 RepID=UPI003317C972
MSDMQEQPLGQTRWRRFALMMGISAAVTTGLVVLTGQGVIAASFSVSGMPFVVTADELQGTGFEQYAVLDQMEPGSPNEGDTGGQLILIVSAVDNAKLTNLCQSINLGGTNLRLTAGSAEHPVTATKLIVDSDLITGDASFTSIDIGQDASTLTRVPGATGGIGIFGQQAETVSIKHLRQNNYATTAATFNLPNLRMGFGDGC